MVCSIFAILFSKETQSVGKDGEFTYLDADEELLEPFEELGWFDGRPVYYWTESIILTVSNLIF